MLLFTYFFAYSVLTFAQRTNIIREILKGKIRLISSDSSFVEFGSVDGRRCEFSIFLYLNESEKREEEDRKRDKSRI